MRDMATTLLMSRATILIYRSASDTPCTDPSHQSRPSQLLCFRIFIIIHITIDEHWLHVPGSATPLSTAEITPTRL